MYLLFHYSSLSLAQESFIQPTVNSPGIYFDPVGSLKIIDGYLSVIIPSDISFIRPHINNLYGVIDSSKRLCKQSKLFTDIECLNLLQPLSIRYQDILRDFESISHLIDNRSKRSAWFGGIGTVFKHLFGVMDEEDAIRYSSAIQTVEKDQTQLTKLIKENILITTSTLSSIKEITENITINEQRLNSAVELLSRHLLNVTSLSGNLMLRAKLNEIVNMVEGSLLALSFKLEDIVNSIMFSKSHILYPSIITPKQLFSELAENYRFLADYNQFPVSLSLENIYLLINVSEIACYFKDNKIVFVLKVPLVTTKDFNLYNCIPFPVTLTNNTFSTIVPSTKYLGMTKDLSSYCKLDSLINCKVLHSSYYICETLDTYSSSVTPICESEIISKALTCVPNQCETKFLQGNYEIWQRLNNNKWIYVINKPSKLLIDCHNLSNTETTISGTGILSIPKHCIAYYKDSKLIPKFTKIIKMQQINSNFNLINDSCCNYVTFNKLKQNIPKLNLKNINLDSVMSEHTKATSLIIKDLDRITEKPHIVLYSEYYCSTTILVSIIVLILTLYLLYKCIRSGKCHRMTDKENKKNIDKNEELSEIVDSIEIPVPKIRTS